jgi:hypothetical protein
MESESRITRETKRYVGNPKALETMNSPKGTTVQPKPKDVNTILQ